MVLIYNLYIANMIFLEISIIKIIFVMFIITWSFVFIMYNFWIDTRFILTNKRIIKFVKNWLFSEHMKELKIDRLNELIFTKKWLIQKFFNYWNIKIIWNDRENVIWFVGVSYPDEIVSYISRLRDFLRENPNFDYTQINEFKLRKNRKKQWN